MTFLDTSVIIDFLAGDDAIVSIVREHAKTDDIKTTTIAEYELLKHKTEIRRQAAKKFLSGVTVCSFDRASAKKAAQLYGTLKDLGKMINENDLLIAGISLAHDEVLLTRDRRFQNIENPNIKVV